MPWGTPQEIQTAVRIKLAAAAYAYEIEDNPIMSDEDFDLGCSMVDLSIETTRPDLDAFFQDCFDPSTGIWIHHHPELDKVAALVQRLRQSQ